MCKYCCLRRSMINRGGSFVTSTGGPHSHMLNYNVMYDSPRWVHAGIIWEWMYPTLSISWWAISYLLLHWAAPFRCCSQSRVSAHSRSSASSSCTIAHVTFSFTKLIHKSRLSSCLASSNHGILLLVFLWTCPNHLTLVSSCSVPLTSTFLILFILVYC